MGDAQVACGAQAQACQRWVESTSITWVWIRHLRHPLFRTGLSQHPIDVVLVLETVDSLAPKPTAVAVVFVGPRLAGDAQLQIQAGLGPLEVARSGAGGAAAGRQEFGAIEDGLQVGQGEGWRLQLGVHVFAGVKVVETIVEIQALELRGALDGVHAGPIRRCRIEEARGKPAETRS